MEERTLFFFSPLSRSLQCLEVFHCIRIALGGIKHGVSEAVGDGPHPKKGLAVFRQALAASASVPKVVEVVVPFF